MLAARKSISYQFSLIVTFYCNVAAAQAPNYLFKHITTANGLISNQVSTVIQDSKGFIWIGTQIGLQRYDGKRFTTYLADVHDESALQSDWISAIFEDSKNRLWIGLSLEGPCILNRSTGKFYNFNLHLPPGAKRINGIWQIIEDKQGGIWLSAYDGFYKLNEVNRQFELVNSLLKMESNTLPSSISVDKKGDLWFATTGGLKKLSIKKNIVFDKNNNPDHSPVFNIKEKTSSITFDDRGNAWVSTAYDHLLYRYDIRNNAIKSYYFNHPDVPGAPVIKEFIGNVFICSNGVLLLPLLSRGLALYNYERDDFEVMIANNNSPQALHLDLHSYGSFGIKEGKEKNIWIASDGGINIFNLERPYFETYGLPPRTENENYPASEVSDFIQTANGDMYTSCYSINGGIKRYDKNFNLKQHYLWNDRQVQNTDADVNQLWGMFQDNTGLIWAPNQAGSILQLDPATNQLRLFKDSLLSGNINQIQQDSENNIWFAHNRKGLIKIDQVSKKTTAFSSFFKPESVVSKRVMCFLLDKDKIWTGTLLNGLQLFDKKKEMFLESFQVDQTNKQSISSNTITGILSYNDDTLIIATQAGINIFDKRKKIFTAIMSKDGLPNNLTQAVAMDGQKNLWAAFAGGFSKINIHNLSITNYDENDGIIDNRFNHSFLKLKDGKLMIGASKSFMVFDPAAVNAASIPPDVTITGFNVFTTPVMADSFINSGVPLQLSYQDNSIYIEFASLQFTASKTIKYFYQLEGVDKNWIAADDAHNVHYNQLSPGNYLFKVKCANRDGLFCKKVTTMAIRIIPPFWKRWWFMVLTAFLVGFILLAIIKWREKNIKVLEAGKTNLQHLTAEKYKVQFESEQISRFFTTSLLNKNDVDDVLWDVSKNLIGKLNFVDCMIYLWNDDKTKMVQKAGYGPKGSLEELEKKHFDVLAGQGVVGAVIQSGEPLIIPDTTIDQRYRVDDLKRMSEICVPIKYNEQLLGVIDSEHHEKYFFNSQHLHVLTTIATLVASKIKSIESEQRLRHQKAELADINQQLAEVQLAALRSQMNPHFIFNALNSIKKFVIANEPANAEKYLGKFSKLIRTILDNSLGGMVTIEKEIQLLKLYLDLEQLRFGTKLTYHIEVEESINTLEIEIPSMIVQPFVENAMLHGIMHREDGGEVSIHFLLHTDWLEITIEDNGVGRVQSAAYKSDHAEPHHSIGIAVASKRLQALKKNNQTPAGITIIDLQDDSGKGIGTKVIIAIPIY